MGHNSNLIFSCISKAQLRRMFIKFLLLRATIFLFTCTVSLCSIVITDSSHFQCLNDFVSDYVKRISNTNSVHVIVDDKVAPETLMMILKVFGSILPIVIQTSDFVPEEGIKTGHIFGIFDYLNSIEAHHWKQIYNNSGVLSPRIAIYTTAPASRSTITKVLSDFWEEDIIDVITINLNASQTIPMVYTYNPFLKSLIEIKVSNDIVGSKNPYHIDKLNNLYGYPIRVTFYTSPPYFYPLNHPKHKYSGDLAVLLFSAKYNNFTIIPTMKDENLYDTKDILKDDYISRKNMDILGSSVYLESTAGRNVEVAYPRWQTSVKAVVPRKPPVPGIYRLLISVESGVLIGSFLTNCILLLFLVITKTNAPLLETVRILLFTNFLKIGNSNSQRIMSMFFIFYSFFIVMIVQGLLVNILSAPPYYFDITNVKELADSNLTFLLPHWEQEVFANSHDPNFKVLYKRSGVEENFTKCILKTIEFRNTACAIDQNVAAYMADATAREIHLKKRQDVAKYMLRVVDEPVISFWRIHMARKGFFLMEKISIANGIILECGFLKRWRNIVNYNIFQEPDERDKGFGINKVMPAIGLLIFGYILSIFVFLIEIFQSNNKHKYSRQKTVRNCELKGPLK